MFSEIPATIPTTRIAVHFSKKVHGHGVAIGTTRSGKFAVSYISPIGGVPTSNVFKIVGTEEEARKVANAEWVAQGF
jgi:hypothetical protein